MAYTRWIGRVIQPDSDFGLATTDLYLTSDLCSCGEAAETVHVLQDCQNYRMLRQAIWSSPNFRVLLKNWKRPTASSTRRGSLFEVGVETKEEEEKEEEEETMYLCQFLFINKLEYL
ncbi:hypothetical protein ElyMa_003089700 [Elysia marginata]|uniref:Reverse transcriptase zinc-binding domain-containing protein n=1 Tax=Elysia marginata TaxID=1093978 RepID=A0AAV4IPH4_9GAST|nr:hypothetical protein ElyMa_003089700 [Elysia marginata]